MPGNPANVIQNRVPLARASGEPGRGLKLGFMVVPLKLGCFRAGGTEGGRGNDPENSSILNNARNAI
jgi:hypothetical protein